MTTVLLRWRDQPGYRIQLPLSPSAVLTSSDQSYRCVGGEITMPVHWYRCYSSELTVGVARRVWRPQRACCPGRQPATGPVMALTHIASGVGTGMSSVALCAAIPRSDCRCRTRGQGRWRQVSAVTDLRTSRCSVQYQRSQRHRSTVGTSPGLVLLIPDYFVCIVRCD